LARRLVLEKVVTFRHAWYPAEQIEIDSAQIDGIVDAFSFDARFTPNFVKTTIEPGGQFSRITHGCDLPLPATSNRFLRFCAQHITQAQRQDGETSNERVPVKPAPYCDLRFL